MGDADLARLAQNSIHIRDHDSNMYRLDADSVLDPTDRRFGIESSNLLQEYYPKAPLVDVPHKPTIDLSRLKVFPPSPGSPSVPRTAVSRARAKSAHPGSRLQQQQVRELAVHLLVPFENIMDDATCMAFPFSPAPPQRKPGEVTPPDIRPKKHPVLEPAMIPTPRPPQKKPPRPSTGGPARRPSKLPDELFWSSSKRINTLDQRRPRVGAPSSVKPPSSKRLSKQAVFVDHVQQARTDMVVDVDERSTKEAPASTPAESPRNTNQEAPSVVAPQLPRNTLLRPASADATRMNTSPSTKILTQRRRELHQRILAHRSTVPKPQDIPVKNLLLKMHCVLDEYHGHEGQFVRRLKQKPEIPMQKKPMYRGRSSRRRTDDAGGAVAPHIYSSNQETSK